VAVKLKIKVTHVEAGLRSFNRAMPEETNRVLTDQISDFLFITSRGAEENLRREGVDRSRIFLVGNVMIDSLRRFAEIAEERSKILSTLSLSPHSYAVLTLHRPETTDKRPALKKVIAAVKKAAGVIPIAYPVHPRSRRRLKDFGLEEELARIKGLLELPPLGYLDFLKLMSSARLVLTDSGGIQEETTALGIACLTLRPETERPITVTRGTNIIVGLDESRILAECRKIMAGRGKEGRIPEYWDGKTAPRIAAILVNSLAPAAQLSCT
jgi:UDP-N-acetylglucosamine 2-epimerase (non-hydrolysing)